MHNGSFDILAKSMQLFLIWAHLSCAFHDYTLNEHEGLQRSIHCMQTPEEVGNVTLYMSFLTKFLVHYETGLRIIEHCVYEMLSVIHPSDCEDL